jgi:phosphoglycerol transferase MdoB-like AlkP superfamily enzyme
MVFGISLSAYTTIHVIISLIAIATGFMAVFQMIANKPLGIWNTIFLWTTIATSVTGFGFPITGITPGIVVGIISLVILAVALLALYSQHLAGPWRCIYVITAIVALWFNVFVLIVQAFQKVPSLKTLAPTQSEPPFQIAQGAALVLFVVLAILAVRKFRPIAA